MQSCFPPRWLSPSRNFNQALQGLQVTVKDYIVFNKLFKPKAPAQITPEAGSTYRISFAGDAAKQPIALPELAASVSRVRTEISSLRAVIGCAEGRRTVGVIMEEICRSKDNIELCRVAREQAQAQARAGLTASSDVLPAMHREDEARDAFRALSTELGSVVQANDAAAALAKLLAEVR
jgi:hypothetical protein